MKRGIILIIISLMLSSMVLSGCKKADDNNQIGNTIGNSIETGNAESGSDEADSKEAASDEAGSEVTGNAENDNNSEITETQNNAGSNDTSADTVSTAGTYEYEQELNMIDDNYRNYYEIFVYSYCDSNGDGIGDFNGISSKLDYISDLGFNGIWLMPIMPSPSYHKYDLTDFYNVDPAYGTLDDFQNLLKECDKRGIKLIIDFVFNHTSAQHPWFREAVTYLEGLGDGEEPDLTKCPYVGYYHFTKDGKGARGYYKAGSSDWYYEGMFWDQMPDLALESKEVRAEIEKASKFWLDMGVGGFRLDAAKEYFSGEPSKNVEVLQWFSDYVLSINPDAYIVGEVWDESSLISTYYESGVASFFNYPLALYDGVIASAVKKLGGASASSYANAIINLRDSYSQKNSDYIDAPFLTNHDNTRISAHFANNEDQMKMAAGLLLTLNGSPFVYYGDEVGMNSMGNKDENKRLPMHWSDTDNSATPKGPSGADDVEQKFAPVDVQQNDPLSILNYYKRAVRIRNENPEIARGEVSVAAELTNQNVCAFKKVYEGSEIVIIDNINSESATISLKDAGYGDLTIRGYLSVDGSAVTLTDGTLNMPKYSIVILK